MPVVGMVGGGQLARMTAQAAIGLGIEFRVLADTPADSAALVCARTQIGDYRSGSEVLAFGAGCDVVTFDHEHVPGEHLAALERLTAVRPGGPALRFAQDKAAMRARLSDMPVLKEIGVRCPRYRPVSAVAEVAAFATEGGTGAAPERSGGGVAGRAQGHLGRL